MPKAKKLPSGSWRCQVYSHTEEILQSDGTTKQKRIYKSFTCDVKGPKGKRIAEKLATEWAEEKENVAKVHDITIGEAIDRYIESRENVLSPRTIMDYKRIRKNDLQSLMGLKIATVSQDDIQRAINIDAQKHSPKTVRNNHGLISAVMKEFRPNFAINTRLPRKVRPDLYVPTDAEIQALIQEISGTVMELPVLLAAFGPMRRGEICALNSDDISRNVVHVCKNMVITENGDWKIKAPKSYNGDRFIDYPDFVAEKWEKKTGRIVDLTPDDITNKFKYCLKRAGLPHFRFHDLRHYSASIQHALGVPDAYIAARGGWDMNTLNGIYKHVLKDKNSEMNTTVNNHFNELYHTKCNTK